MTEQGALRDPLVERRFEHVDVVDALPGVRAFAEQILVHVGDCEGVRVQSAGAGEHALEQRSVTTRWQRRRDSRLKHAVSLDHAAADRIQPRTVEGMRHLPD